MPRAVSALVALVACLALAPAASAQEPCSTLVVTEDTVLDRDIDCGRAADGSIIPAIEIGAPNITLDLNGYKVTGGAEAIRNPGFDGVTIKNGTAHGSNFPSSILIEHADRNTVRGIHFEIETSPGVTLIDSDDSLIANNTGASYRPPIQLLNGSDRNLVYGNKISGYATAIAVSGRRNAVMANTANSGESTVIGVSGLENVIAYNSIDSPGSPSEGRGYGDAIRVGPLSTWNVLLGNVANDRNENGIRVESSRNILIANTANNNRLFGILAVPGVIGIGNRASGNGTHPLECLYVRCS